MTSHEDKDLSNPEYSGKRLRVWVSIQMEDFDVSIEELQTEFNAARPNYIRHLLDRKSKFPWKALPILSRLFTTDYAILLPLYLDQEVDEELREEVFETACCFVSDWEFPALEAIRRAYIDDRDTIWTHTPEHQVSRYY